MKKIVPLFSVIIMLALVLSACGGTTAAPAAEEAAPAADAAEPTAEMVEEAPAEEAPAEEELALTLWVYDDTRISILNQLGEEFMNEYGVGLKVEVVDLSEIRNAMSLGATTGEGPDLIIIPHDNIGPMVENGSASEIDLGSLTSNYVAPSISGFTYNGKIYGVPLSVENIGFFRNMDMVPDAPQTWTEVADVATQLVDDGTAESGIGLPDLGYNIYPLYTSFGGYIFGKDVDGNYTPDDIGMNSAGMVEAMQWVKDLVDAGVVPSTIDWEAAHVAFETGKSPFIFTGPWAITRFKTAGVNYAISDFPSVEEGGTPGAPFMGVQGLVVNATRPNVALAMTFATEFIPTETHYQMLFEADTRPSAWTTVFESATDPDTASFNHAGVNAQPMPAIPAMGYVWDAWTNAGNLVMTDEATAQEAFDTSVEQIEAQLK
ncbi:MAG: maltose ABC transporter substrate-binding protein [Anaerolineaceae bacterium]|nr:maltose ABC transporter substrate-binding protein [Anaerolineaceae bacterium]